MKTYYELLHLTPKASGLEVERAFRRYVARVRPTSTVEQVFTDPHFRDRLNAYLALTRTERSRYDALLREAPSGTPPQLDMLSGMASLERRHLMARVALWRQEPGEAMHILRGTLEREPNWAAGWAQLGEVYFTVGRVMQGAEAYERALRADPANAVFAQRLSHAQEVMAGKTTLRMELSPEEEMLLEERRQRARTMAAIIVFGLVLIAYAYWPPLTEEHVLRYAGALYVPWNRVVLQGVGAFFLLGGLAYGRVIAPFEQVMLWSSITTVSRGAVRSTPYGLLLFVTSAVCLWLSVVTLVIMGIMDEEWPAAPSIMLGACMVLTLLMTYAVHLVVPGHWTGTFMVGGNLLALGAMIGWWAGSYGAVTFE